MMPSMGHFHVTGKASDTVFKRLQDQQNFVYYNISSSVDGWICLVPKTITKRKRGGQFLLPAKYCYRQSIRLFPLRL